jgi:hypothetical protein
MARVRETDGQGFGGLNSSQEPAPAPPNVTDDLREPENHGLRVALRRDAAFN